MLCFAILLSSVVPASPRVWVVDNQSPSANDNNPGTPAAPLKTVNKAAQNARAGDTISVESGIYRERISPARSGTKDAPITYTAAPNANVVLRASEVLHWTEQKNGTYAAALPASLFDTLDGTSNSSLYNPFLNALQPGVGCNAATTGQVHINGQPLAEVYAWQPASDVQSCKIAYQEGHKIKHYHATNGCFQPQQNGTLLVMQLPNAMINNETKVNDSEIEVTVRSRVFAPHTRGLQYITVQGFVMEYAANNWCANFWFPQNWKYAQSGLLGTRSGFGWVIHNNTLRHAKTIGLDIGIEGGYKPAGGGDNEGTNQSIPNVTGAHTVTHNIIEYNGASGIQGYGASPDFAVVGNIVRTNGHNGCGGAENAGVKLHGFEGTFERNVITQNTNGVPAWFDSGGHNARISRNVFMVPGGMQSGGVAIELTDGPVLFDNNLVLGGEVSGGGGGIGSQDAANITVAHNLVSGFHDGSTVSLGGLTGRTVGSKTASLRSWWVGANVLLTTGKTPWIEMHHEKHSGSYELVYNETARHNVVAGWPGVYPDNATLKIDVSSNYNSTDGSFSAMIDRDAMVLTLQRSSAVNSGCAPGGPGGDAVFTGSARSSGSACMAGPLATLPADSAVNISLWAALNDDGLVQWLL